MSSLIPHISVRYANKKQEQFGGSVDGYIQKYYQQTNRLSDILKERGLMKDVPTFREDKQIVRLPKTLFEAGFIEHLPPTNKIVWLTYTRWLI